MCSNAGQLLQVKPTIDVERLAGNIIPIDDQVANSASYLLRSAVPAERYPGQDRLLRLLWDRLEHLCSYKTGADSINRYVRTGQFQVSRFGEPNNAGFGSRIVGLAKVPHLAYYGTDVDDLTTLLLHEMGQRGFHSVEIAVQVNLDDLIPILRRHILHGAVNIDPRVIDEYIDAAKAANSLFDKFGCLRRVRYIALNGYSFR